MLLISLKYAKFNYSLPTIPHCSMAQIIGLMIKVKLLNNLPKTMKSNGNSETYANIFLNCMTAQQHLI